MSPPLFTLQECLTRLGASGVSMIRPGGNFGDYLIYEGARQLARRVGVSVRDHEWHSPDAQRLDPQCLAYVHGSGGFVSWWSGRPFEILGQLLSAHPGVVVVGPSSCSGERDLLERRFLSLFEDVQAQRVIFFARERTTYAILGEILPDWVEIYLDHDTASHCTPEGLDVAGRVGRYRLVAIRNDRESTRPEASRPWWWVDPAVDAADFRSWVELHAGAREIVTDRTHSAVLGAVLGKPTTLLPGAYHKNRSIWEYTLHDRGVRFKDATPLSRAVEWMEPIPGAKRVLGSWKLNRWWLNRMARQNTKNLRGRSQ